MNTMVRGLVLTSALIVLGTVAIAQSPTTQDPSVNWQERFERLQADHERRLSELEARYSGRIASLESEVGELRADAATTDAAEIDALLEQRLATMLTAQDERVGIGMSGQTTIFDNAFNPAFSLVADFILPISTADDSFESLNQFRIRAIEFGISGRVDPNLAYYFVLHLDEEEVEFEEAYAEMDGGLPSTFTLKFGRFNSDFGRLSPVHDHDLPFVDKPAVLQEFLGGALRGTGLEIHQWFSAGDTAVVRWSVGVVNSLGGEAHPILGPLASEEHEHGEEEGPEPFGERGFDDFSFTGRIAAQFETGEDSTVTVGGSVAWAPTGRTFLDDPAVMGNVLGVDLESVTVGIDVAFQWIDASTGEGLTVMVEGLYTDRDFADEMTAAVTSDCALGFYAAAIYSFDNEWSLGVSGGVVERLENTDQTYNDIGAFLTWQMNEFNRMRFEIRFADDELNDVDDFALLIQWTTLLGSHGHPVSW